MDITDLNTAITQLNSAITTLKSTTTSITAIDLASISNTLSTVSTNLQGVINDFPNYNEMESKLAQKASINTQTVTANLRTVLGQILALQNVYFGEDTTSPTVHASSIPSGIIDLSNYSISATGELSETENTEPSIDTLKGAVPSFFDLISVAVALYQMIIGHSHNLDVDQKNRALEVLTESSQIASFIKNIKPSINSTGITTISANIDTNTIL